MEASSYCGLSTLHGLVKQHQEILSPLNALHGLVKQHQEILSPLNALVEKRNQNNISAAWIRCTRDKSLRKYPREHIQARFSHVRRHP